MVKISLMELLLSSSSSSAAAAAASSSSSSLSLSSTTSSTSLQHQKYIDVIWLKSRGLFKETAIEYFCHSPFYDQSANNQSLLVQGLSMDHLIDMVGLEYILDPDICPPLCPDVYIFRKQHRYDRRNVQVLELYYCVDGCIYQSPVILDLIRTRIAKTSHHLLNALNFLLKHVSYTAISGTSCYVRDEEENGAPREKVQITSNKQFAANREFPSLTTVLTDLSSSDFLNEIID